MKNYILDTNVLLHDPNSLLNFQDNYVLIPIEVIEEIDRLNGNPPNWAKMPAPFRACSMVSRAQGHLSDGVKLPNGGQLRIILPAGKRQRPRLIGEHTWTAASSPCASGSKSATNENPTILVTKDINLRIKADALGLRGGGLRNRPRLHQGSLHRHVRENGQPGKNGRLPRQRRTGTATGGTILSRTNIAP